MRSLPRAQRRPSLALDQMRCASGCRALALDLAVPGTTKVCIHCWQQPGWKWTWLDGDFEIFSAILGHINQCSSITYVHTKVT